MLKLMLNIFVTSLMTYLLNMFTIDDKVLIFALRVDKGWSARKNDERISWKKLETKLFEQINKENR